MKTKKLKVLAILIITLLYLFVVSAYAYSLDDGSVHGLPEKLVVLDDSGRSVSADGSYYFSVTDMKPGITYVKNIQIMNLRDDKSYSIYFSAESVSSTGDIDLENECECVVILDDQEVYRGKVTGEGTPDMQKTPLDLGKYAPNEYRYMKVSVTWNGTSAGGFVDNGERIVTASGTEIVRGKTGETYISGETEFKWIFTAQVEKDNEENSKSEVESSSRIESSQTSSKETSSKAASSKETSSKETSSKAASSKETSSKETSSKATSSKETSSKEISSKETSSKGTSSQDSSSNASKYTSSNLSSNLSSNSSTSSKEIISQSSVSSSVSTGSEYVSSMLAGDVSNPSRSSETATNVSKGNSSTNDSNKTSSTVTLESFVQTGETIAIIAIICILTASLILMVLTAKRKQNDE